MVLEKENRDIVGGESEGISARGERGRHFKFRLLRPISPFAVTAVQQGVEERQLQLGAWQRERHFLLTLAVRAFPSVTGLPLKSSVSPLHTLVRGKGCSGGVCAASPTQDFSRAVGTSPAKPLPHSTLRAHKWEKLVMRRGKHRD